MEKIESLEITRKVMSHGYKMLNCYSSVLSRHEDIKNWLRTDKNLHIVIDFSFKSGIWDFYIRNLSNKVKKYSRVESGYKNYESALENAIKFSIEHLEKDNLIEVAKSYFKENNVNIQGEDILNKFRDVLDNFTKKEQPDEQIKRRILRLSDLKPGDLFKFKSNFHMHQFVEGRGFIPQSFEWPDEILEYYKENEKSISVRISPSWFKSKNYYILKNTEHYIHPDPVVELIT